MGGVNERQFNEILPLIDPLYLLLDGVRVADLTPLGRFQRLEAMEIRWNTKFSDISFLETLTDLRLLALSHCPKVHDLGPVSALTDLEIIDLSGGMWSTFKPDSLEPLGRLHKLRGLSIRASRVKDQSLAPVAKLKQLQELELRNQFPTEEYARLSVALPHIQCTHFSPISISARAETLARSWSPARESRFFPYPKTRNVLSAMSNGSAKCRRVLGPNKSDPWRGVRWLLARPGPRAARWRRRWRHPPHRASRCARGRRSA